MDWIDVAQDRNRWRKPMNVVMNIRLPQNMRNFVTEDIRRILLKGFSYYAPFFPSNI